MAGTPKQNKKGIKFEDSKIRKKAWTFKHSTLTYTSKTMEKFIKETSINFRLYPMKFAVAKSYAYWLGLGFKMMTERLEKYQPAVYQMFIRILTFVSSKLR